MVALFRPLFSPNACLFAAGDKALAQRGWFWQCVYMAQTTSLIEQEPLVVHTRPVIDMDDEQFFQFCQLNRDLQIERTAEGDIIIMAPEGGSSGLGSSELTLAFGVWAHAEGTGRIFGPSTGFTLTNGATRSPDVAWVRNQKL